MSLREQLRRAVASCVHIETQHATFGGCSAPVEAAILLRVADLYENREAVTDRSLYDNPTFARLLAPYRVMAL